MTDEEYKVSFENEFNKLAILHGINLMAERNSYITYDIINRSIKYKFHSEFKNEFMKDAEILIRTFTNQMN